jgi:hypothetical protein
MSEVIKNSVTGLYNLQIGNSVFESKEADHFIIDTQEIENTLIGTLPVNVIIELTKPNQDLELNLKHLYGDLVDIIIYEVEGWIDSEYVSHYFYNELKGELIQTVDSNKTKIEFHNIDHDGDWFEYTMRFSATTVGEAVQRALEIDKSLNDKMIQVGEQGGNYMKLVANGALQIDISNIFHGKDKNSKV